MFRALFYLAANVFTVLLLSRILENFKVESTAAAIVFILVLTLLNWTVVPIIKFFAIPFNFLTLGLANLIINIITLLITINSIKGIDLTGEFNQKALNLVIISFCLAIATSVADHLNNN